MVRAAEVLAGRYEVGELLGVGGMGDVYQARDRVLHRDVAIKVLKDQLSSDQATLERFTREARIAAGLSHPCIAAVFDFVEEGQRSFIVMELLRGSDLHKVLVAGGPLDSQEALRITAAVADALHHAHEQQAVHRDVKPGNIFLTDDGAVKVTDFGIATAAAQAPLTATGDVLGTPYYLSPEQVRGEPATPASDIYSLGCVLFEMVTATRPFEAESSMAVAMAHGSRPVPSARQLNPSVPEDVDALIEKAMAKQPGQRFTSAADMAAAARSAAGRLSGAPTVAGEGGPQLAPTAAIATSAGPPTMVATPAASLWQRPRLVAAALVAAMVVVVLLAQLCSSAAPASVAVPNLVSMPYEQAAGRLDELGFKVRRGMVALSGQPAGHVYAQRPAAGTRLAKGSPVMLFVSSGKGSRAPNLVNLTVDQAAEALKAAGLKGVIVSRVAGAAGDVIVSQDPPAGTLLKAGESIRLTVTRIPEEAPKRDEDKGAEGEREQGKGKGKGGDD